MQGVAQNVKMLNNLIDVTLVPNCCTSYFFQCLLLIHFIFPQRNWMISLTMDIDVIYVMLIKHDMLNRNTYELGLFLYLSLTSC
jgi:hypothetical protein